MGVVLLVRHGQASFGSDDYDVLSETGWGQGRLLGKWLAEQRIRPARIVSGDMRRHRETAEAMIDGAGWETPAPEVDADWNEFDHLGIVSSYSETPADGMTRREFQAVFEQATTRWTAGEDHGFAETYGDFCGRVRAALGRVTSAPSDGPVVVVSSGGTIAATAADLVDPAADPATHARLWQRFNTVVVNSSVSRVIVGATGTRLLTYNEHAHLTPETLTYR